MIKIAQTYIISLVGVGVFWVADLPLPWLLGPILACLIAALAGLDLRGAKPVNDAMRAILGVAIGATLTVSVLAGLPALWPTLVLVPVVIASAAIVGVPYFQRLWGFDFATSYYSAMPGGLQDMLAFGEEAGGDVRALSLIHATRVMLIVVSLPFLLEGIWGVDLSSPPGEPALSLPPSQIALMAAAGLGGWFIAKRLGMFGASILGPMIAAGTLSVLGIIEHRPPAEAIWMAQFFIGMTVGAKYSGVTLEEVRRDLAAAFGYCLILLIISVIAAEAVILLGLAPPLEALLAFAPGGQAEMAILALLSGADVAFVVAHHMLRLACVIVGAPLAARLFTPKPPG